jgi:3-isopropylmalate dehydratase small subunit
MTIHGKAWTFGDDVDTDIIIGAIWLVRPGQSLRTAWNP